MSIPSSTRAVWNEFENEKSRRIGDRYIHTVTMRADMHVIITINSDLAEMVHNASWIMVDTTFAVVHGTTNVWKLLIWLNSLDKRTVIGRVWTDRATGRHLLERNIRSRRKYHRQSGEFQGLLQNVVPPWSYR
ncbi:hypothetical protein B0H13DRAFT_2302313 [Mycena leptocephala]|nr:hypothetical protein B0H13DRAFT_2302313 [Mycena leptocephala]